MLRRALKRRKKMKNGEIADISGYSTRLTGTKRITALFLGVAGGILAGVFVSRSFWNKRNPTGYCRTL